VRQTGANATVIFVPPPFAGRRDHGSGRRGHRAGRLHHRGHSACDMLKALTFMSGKQTRLIGPNCPG
jgi:succinyl-CoA synthetase alpha subunit